MVRLINNEISLLPIYESISNIKNHAKKIRNRNTIAEGVSGDKCIEQRFRGTLELYRNGKKIFTDYPSLYKFNEGWRIVSKTIYRHP